MNIEIASRPYKTLSACCLGLIISALAAVAAPIAVVNGDFSSPVLSPDGLSNSITGWTRDVTGSITFGGTANNGDGFSEIYPGMAYGNQFGYNVWNSAVTGTLSYTQQLSVTLTNDTLYTINLDIAQSISFALPTFTDGYSDIPGVNDIVVRLLAGGQVFGTFSSTVPVVPGSLSPWTISQQSSANETLAGEQLTLEILVRKSSDSTIQFAMDNISVDAQAIPEPGTIGFLVVAAGVGVVLRIRRKQG